MSESSSSGPTVAPGLLPFTNGDRGHVSSFGPVRDEVVTWTVKSDVPLSTPYENISDGTLSQQALKRFDPPVVVSKRNSGRRSFRVLATWEGVVEEVHGDRFVARLIPIVDGLPDRSNIEQTDFHFDEVAYEDDLRKVAPGAIFFWTVGRRMDAAGTLENTSLVRFRRQADRTANRMRAIDTEVEDILSALEAQDGTDAPGAR